MSHIDALSRVPVKGITDAENEIENDKIGIPLAMTVQNYVITMQQSDSKLREIMSVLSNNDQPQDQQIAKVYKLKNCLQYQKVQVAGKLRS